MFDERLYKKHKEVIESKEFVEVRQTDSWVIKNVKENQ